MAEHIVQLSKVSKAFGAQIALHQLDLCIEKGEFLTLLGPSGCGKTTLLRLISGFEEADSGDIIIAGKKVNDIAPQQRQVHTVFQSYALFPHMSVFENVAFGLRCQKVAKEEISQRVLEALAIVKLEHLASRFPGQLSGGQQQRVAIARAVVNRPLLLLLDEPLSSLDYRLRKDMQLELKQLQRKLDLTFVFVTHDQEEALSISDRVAVFEDGVIHQLGTPREVYETPVNLTVAKFIGETNIFATKVLSCDQDLMHVCLEGQEMQLRNTGNYQADDEINVIVRPEDIRVNREGEECEVTSQLEGTIDEVIYRGSTVDLRIRLHSGKLISASEFFDEDDEDLEYRIGEAVVLYWYSGWEVILKNEH